MTANDVDLLLGLASLVLTVFIFSYLLGDNLLYRIAVNLLVGITAGFMVIVAVEGVILPWLRLTALNDEANLAIRAVGIVPFLLGSALVMKQLRGSAPLGNLGLAFIIGVGTAVAIVGAVVGTLLPLTQDAGDSLDRYGVVNGLIMSIGTITTLIYFQYWAKRDVDGKTTRSRPLQWAANIGQGFIALTLGAFYGGVMITSLSVLTGVIAEQLAFIVERLS